MNLTINLRRTVWVLVTLLLLMFCVTKIIRGTQLDSNTEGGIWNYIALMYYPIALLVIVMRRHRAKWLFIWAFLYTVVATVVSLFYLPGHTITPSRIFSMIMIPFFLVVFVCFYSYADDTKAGNIILMVTFFSGLLINAYTIIRFQIFGASRAFASDIYFTLGMFPFFLQLVKHQFTRIAVTIFLFFIAFMSGKRAGFIGFCVAVAVYMLVNEIVQSHRLRRVIVTIVLVSALVVAVYFLSRYLDNIWHTGLYTRLERLDEDGGGGRDRLYESVWKAFVSSPFPKKLFGHGFYATSDVVPLMAHNDFLEILYDYGIVALIFMLVFLVLTAIEAVKMIIRKSPYAAAFSASLVIGLFLSMFSFLLIYFTYVICFSAMWGYCLGMEKKRLKALEEQELQSETEET